MNRTLFVVFAGALVVVLAGSIYADVLKQREIRALQAKANKLHDYCSSVAVAVALDAQQLEKGTEAQKLDAANHFGEQVTFHSVYEIQLCAKRPVDLTKRPMCAIGPDYPCLAELARNAADALR